MFQTSVTASFEIDASADENIILITNDSILKSRN